MDIKVGDWVKFKDYKEPRVITKIDGNEVRYLYFSFCGKFEKSLNHLSRAECLQDPKGNLRQLYEAEEGDYLEKDGEFNKIINKYLNEFELENGLIIYMGEAHDNNYRVHRPIIMKTEFDEYVVFNDLWFSNGHDDWGSLKTTFNASDIKDLTYGKDKITRKAAEIINPYIKNFREV